MDKKQSVIEKINVLGESSFKRLQELNVPPYPKYYHDAFVDELLKCDDLSLIALSKKYAHLFSHGENEKLEETSLELAKASLKEFEKSNSNLKKLSDKNVIDISTIKSDYDRINTDAIINSFNNFQTEILEELENADETIKKLKIEIERLEKESHIDPLTKTYNRKVFNKDIKEIIDAVEGKGSVDLNLVIFDADDFKNINDTYGHSAGDKTLIFLTKLIKNSLRNGTKIYRYGGEEFIIILNRVTLEDTCKTVQRILDAISSSKLLYKGHEINLTLSAGIGQYKQNDTSQTLLEKADKALYDAKKSGKNCFKVAE